MIGPIGVYLPRFPGAVPHPKPPCEAGAAAGLVIQNVPPLLGWIETSLCPWFSVFSPNLVFRNFSRREKPSILPVFRCISQNSQNHNFRKIHVLWLSVSLFFWEIVVYTCDPMCENHWFCLCFAVFLRISKIVIFVKFMFCDLVFGLFLWNRGFTHATRCAKTIDFACVSVYFSEFSKSPFS